LNQHGLALLWWLSVVVPWGFLQFLGRDRGFFERRGREGFAKGAKKENTKIKPKIKYCLHQSKLIALSWNFNFVFLFSDVFFCALCETFARSAFKNPRVQSLE
jgi:hypothetical protein